MFAGSERPGGAASELDYWLRRCEGFRVDSPGGRFGVVEEVRYVSRSDRPDMIAVRTGLFGRRLLLVPVREIAEIIPSDERLVLRRPPRRSGTERLGDLRWGVEVLAAGSKRLAVHKEVNAVFHRLRHLIGRIPWRGGEREMTPEAEPPAEPTAEEQPGEEAAAEEAPAEEAAEEAPAEEAPAEETPAEEEPTV
jgi:hypothetical protein